MAAAAGLRRKFRVGLVQMTVGEDKAANFARAANLVRNAARKGAQLVALPECFNTPYGAKYFQKHAEPLHGHTTNLLSEIAKECKIYLVGGSFPESDGDKIYNTCTVFNPNGDMLGKYRKLHLYDVDVPGKITFQESRFLSPGNEFFTFETDWCRVGVGICYDIRFPELASIYNQKGCKLLCYPGAFNMKTGPAHWRLLVRSTALSNQIYMAGVSAARSRSSGFVSWAHSMLVDPWGEVVTNAEEDETIAYGDVDLDYLDQVRTSIPISKQKRLELYKSATVLS